MCFAGSDYFISPSLVVFNFNETKKNVTIMASVDMQLEFTEVFYLAFEISPEAKEIGVENISSISMFTILNNDSKLKSYIHKCVNKLFSC